MEFRGYITSIPFQAEKGDGCIAKVHANGRSYVVTGALNKPLEGDVLHVTGKMVYGKGGECIKATSMVRMMPQTEVEARALLLGTSGLGPSVVESLMRQCGKDAPLAAIQRRVGLEEPQASFISNKLIERLGAALVRDEMITTFGLKPALAGKIAGQLGPGSYGKLKDNPYFILEPGLGDFRAMDASILTRGGLTVADPRRIVAACKFVLKQAGNLGDTCLPTQAVLREINKLGVPATKEALESAVSTVPHVEMPKRMGDNWSHPTLWKAENDIATYLATLARKPGALAPRKLPAELTDEQQQAVKNAFKPVSIMTGGPGCGKTFTIKAMVGALGDVTLCAPTGKAAKRMTESTGEPARTLHALMQSLRLDPQPIETLLIDEASMVSVDLLAQVLELAKPKRLILVGDANQLPAVGPGRILGDLVESGLLPTTTLTKIQRQAEGSQIVANAQRIVAGNPIVVTPGAHDFFVTRGSPEQQIDLLRKALVERIPKLTKKDGQAYNPLWDVQIMVPQHKGVTGVASLNNSLRDILNPAEGQEELKFMTHSGSVLFREGDKVLVNKNLYNKGVMNGEVGEVVAVKLDPPTVEIEFEGIGEHEEDKTVAFDGEELNYIQPGFACTVHKSQGGEAPMIIGVFNSEVPSIMRARNLLYTAVTRAREKVWLLTEGTVLDECIRNNRPSERRTLLRPMLEKGLGPLVEKAQEI